MAEKLKAQFNTDGTVINLIVVDPDDHNGFPGALVPDGLPVAIGWRWDGAQFITPPKYATLAEAQDAKRGEIDASYLTAINVIAGSYSETERNSWAKQEQEARAWVANNAATTPLLSAIAAARGTPLADICQRVINNANAYAVYAGGVIGKRQALMIRIAAATRIAEVEAIVW